MSTTNEMKLTQLDLLKEAQGLLPDEEIAQRAREILDGPTTSITITPNLSGIRRPDVAFPFARKFLNRVVAAQLDIPSTRLGIADYLIRKGHKGPDVARLIVDFERAVAVAYVEQHDDYPPRDDARVFIFDASDKGLIDRVYEAEIDAIAEANGVEL